MSLGHSVKRNRLTVALGAVFLSLLAAIAYLQWQSNSHSNNAAPRRAAEDVQTITVSRPNEEPIVLQRNKQSPEQWQLTSPVQIPANAQRIVPLLTVFTNPDPGYAISSVDLQATGLNSPEATVLFDDYVVKIGQVAVDGSKRHALHGERVRFVPDWVLPFLQGGVSALADLTLWGETLNNLNVDANPLDASQLALAKVATAQQYVAWPRPENPTVLSTRTLSVEMANAKSEWTLFETDRYAAIQPPSSTYAYIVSLDEVPWLFP